ncbi:hypothetical protein ABZT26_36105 [Streptomyces sp. NPDC005395]|uniref:hypothetical protein n=1 Tax=Streptomyces sp. NPDC005395 TaxID=3157042 RepID=UPI0033BE3952
MPAETFTAVDFDEVREDDVLRFDTHDRGGIRSVQGTVTRITTHTVVTRNTDGSTGRLSRSGWDARSVTRATAT